MTNPLSPHYMDTKSTLYSPIRDSVNTSGTSNIPVMSDYHQTGAVAVEEEVDDEIEEAGPSQSSVSEEAYKQLKRKMKEITEVVPNFY
jgi:hypothetical protein